MKTHRGELFEEDNKIIKITTDVVEFNNAKILIQNPKQCFVIYYSAKDIGDGKYELIMEKLLPLSDAECDMIDIIMNSLGIEKYMLDDNKRNSFIKELQLNPEYYDDFATYKQMYHMVTILKNMYTEAKQIGIELLDLRCDNIGKRRNGDVVHFDLGAG